MKKATQNIVLLKINFVVSGRLNNPNCQFGWTDRQDIWNLLRCAAAGQTGGYVGLCAAMTDWPGRERVEDSELPLLPLLTVGKRGPAGFCQPENYRHL